MRKLIKDGKVGVVISNSKWYTDHKIEQLVYLPELITTLESEEYITFLNKYNSLDKKIRELKSYLNSTKQKSADKVLQRTSEVNKAIKEQSEVELTLYSLLKISLSVDPLITINSEDEVFYVRYQDKQIYIPLCLKVQWVSLNTYFRVNYDWEYDNGEHIELFYSDSWMIVKE